MRSGWIGQSGRVAQVASADALLHGYFVEVQQQTEGQAADAQIGEQLRLMQGQNLLYGFDFEHERLFDDDVDFQVAVDGFAFVEDRQFLLPDEVDAREGKFMAQTCFVDGLKQSGS